MASVLALLALVGCRGGSEMASNNPTQSEVLDAGMAETSTTDVIAEDSVAPARATTPASAAALPAEDEATLEVAAKSTANAVTIALNGDSIAVEGDGVTINGSTATLTTAGNYVLSGTLDDGQIIVDTDVEAAIQLTVNGVDIRSTTSAPIALMNSEQVVIILTDGSANYVEDTSAYTYPDPEEEEPSAAIFSNDGLTITRNGSLTITGNYNDAISSDDGITIEGGAIGVAAADGLYTNGTYSPGTEYDTFTVSSVTTTPGGGAFR